MNRLTRIAPYLSLVLALAAGAAAAQNKIDPGWPQWLQDAMAKEYDDDMPYARVEFDGSSTFMPGKVTGREAVDDDTLYVVTDDGSGTPFECWFFQEPKDVSQSLYNISELVIRGMVKEFGALTGRQVFHIDAGEIDGAPYLALEWLLALGQPPNARVALSKVRAAERNGRFVACSHAMVGYRHSFEQAFAGVVKNLDTEFPNGAPYYSEVYVASFGGLKTGFTRMDLTRDDDGDTRVRLNDAMLLPVDSSTVQTTDSTSSSWSTPDGLLINTQYGAVENGELVADLALRNDDEAGWQVSGTLSGKPLAVSLSAEKPPLSSLGEMMVIRDLLKNRNAMTAEVHSWVPSTDPTVFTRGGIARDNSSDAPGALILNIGNLEMKGEFDANGSGRFIVIDLGAAQLRIDRVYQSGNIF